MSSSKPNAITDADTPLSTPVFRMPQSAMLRWMYSQVPVWVLILAGAIVVVCVLLGALVNLRWIAVGLMVLLIGVPAVGAWLYIDLGMRTATAFNVLPHTVTVSEAGIDIMVIAKSANEDEEESEARITQFHFGPGEIKAPVAGLDAATIPLAATPEGFIWLPNKYESETAEDTAPDTTTTPAIIKFVKKTYACE